MLKHYSEVSRQTRQRLFCKGLHKALAIFGNTNLGIAKLYGVTGFAASLKRVDIFMIFNPPKATSHNYYYCYQN